MLAAKQQDDEAVFFRALVAAISQGEAEIDLDAAVSSAKLSPLLMAYIFAELSVCSD